MISFKEYHKQMEILNESKNETKKYLENIEKDIENGKAPDEKMIASVKDRINNGDISINEYTFNILKMLFDKNIYIEEDAKKIKNKLQELSKNNNREEIYKKVFAEEEPKEESKEESKEEPKEESKEESKEEPKEEEIEDSSSDYQWLYNNKEKIRNLLDKHDKNSGTDDLNKDLLAFFIVSDIAFQKLIRIRDSYGKKSLITVKDKRVKFPMSLTPNSNKYSINFNSESSEIGKNFVKILEDLKKLKCQNSLRISDLVSDYVNKNKEMELNQNDISKIKNDVQNNLIFNKKQEKKPANVENEPLEDPNKLDNVDSKENQESKSPDLSDSAKAGRAIADDPNDVNSLTMDSDDKAIQIAIDGTFGVSSKNPGSIFTKAIERANKARTRIAKDSKADDEYIKNAVDRKKELSSSVVVHENVILKELKSNPLLKEECEILQEKLFGPEGERAKTRWANKLGKDEDGIDGDLEQFRSKKRNEALKAFDKIKNRYVGNSTRADAVNKIQKIGDSYVFGLNKRINSLIKKGNYGPITSLIRDVKVANADRIAKKNENYAATGKGKAREAMEDAILKRLEEWNNNIAHVKNKKTTKKQIINILSTWAMAKQSTLDLFAPKNKIQEIENLLGGRKLEEGKKIIDNFIDFGKTEINPGIDMLTYNHIKTLLSSGKYNKLVSFATGTNIANKINNLVRDSYNANQQENGQQTGEKKQETSSPEAEKTAVKQNSKFLGEILIGMFNKIRLKNKAKDVINNDKKEQLQNQGQNMDFSTDNATNQAEKATSVVTEEYMLTEEGTPISKSGAEEAVLKALSLNAQEAAEGKQWIIDNIYKGNPLASKIVDQFVSENSSKRAQANKVLAIKNQQSVQQPVQQPASTGTPQQVAAAMQTTNQPVVNQQANAQQSTATQQNKPVNATVTTAAADGFPNRLYKKIIRRKIGF